MHLPITRPATLLAAIILVTMTFAALVPAGTAAGEPQEGRMTVYNPDDGTAIDIMVCKPASASAANPVPVILHSHGWAGSRSNCGFGSWLDAGFGVVSISQRGHGASGGQAYVHEPDLEGQDNIAVIDRIATFDWVAMDGPNDPKVGAIGGSYGGAYQFITALTEIRDTGTTRLDALAPEITWFDLPESLAPQGVIRTAWVTALYAAGAGNVHNGIHQSYWYAMATNQLPDGTVPGVYNLVDDFAGNSPKWFVENGMQLDIPVLIGQGLTDNLFNLNQAWHNFEETLTPAARGKSMFIGYNGGHALPNVAPVGVIAGGDPCSAPFGGFSALSIAFFTAHFAGENTRLTAKPYNLATTDGACLALDSLSDRTSIPILGDVKVAASTAGAGGPIHIPLATGPLTVAGIPTLTADVTALGLDARAFFALSAGTSPATAQVLSNNMMPIKKLLPTVLEGTTIELAGVAATLEAGETLYLTVSAISDMSAANGSRTPGAMVLTDAVVHVPLVA